MRGPYTNIFKSLALEPQDDPDAFGNMLFHSIGNSAAAATVVDSSGLNLTALSQGIDVATNSIYLVHSFPATSSLVAIAEFDLPSARFGDPQAMVIDRSGPWAIGIIFKRDALSDDLANYSAFNCQFRPSGTRLRAPFNDLPEQPDLDTRTYTQYAHDHASFTIQVSIDRSRQNAVGEATLSIANHALSGYSGNNVSQSGTFTAPELKRNATAPTIDSVGVELVVPPQGPSVGHVRLRRFSLTYT